MSRSISSSSIGATDGRTRWTRRIFRAVFWAVVVVTLSLAMGCVTDDEEEGGGSGGGGGTNPAITIHNNTGYTLQGSVIENGLYIKPTTSSDWGSNIASSSSYTINNSEAKTITLPARITNNNVYDIQWRSSSGRFTKNNVSLSFGMTVIFTSSDLE